MPMVGVMVIWGVWHPETIQQEHAGVQLFNVESHQSMA